MVARTNVQNGGDALARLGRYAESVPIRRQVFESTISPSDFARWLDYLPDPERAAAHDLARELAQTHDDPAAAATLLLELGDASGATTIACPPSRPR